MFGQLPEFFKSVEELQEKWANPKTREELLEKLDEVGYGRDVLKQVLFQNEETSYILEVITPLSAK